MSRAGAELTKKNVIIVGDSQLRNINCAKLSNEHFNVTVKTNAWSQNCKNAKRELC